MACGAAVSIHGPSWTSSATRDHGLPTAGLQKVVQLKRATREGGHSEKDARGGENDVWAFNDKRVRGCGVHASGGKGGSRKRECAHHFNSHAEGLIAKRDRVARPCVRDGGSRPAEGMLEVAPGGAMISTGSRKTGLRISRASVPASNGRWYARRLWSRMPDDVTWAGEAGRVVF